MQITLYPLHDADIEAVTKVIVRSILISQKDVYPEQLLAIFVQKYTPEKFRKKAQEIEYFIAKIDDARIVGVIGLKENEVRTFFVDPDYQGKGVGRALYTELEKRAKTRGVKKLVVDASPLGEPIYAKFGFRKQGTKTKAYNGVSFIDAYMEKFL